MERKIKIGEKEIPFKATAATPIKFRRTFGKDIMVELMGQNDETFNNFEAIENLAYIMAGGTDLGMDIEEWMDQFELTDFYGALEEIMLLWTDSQTVTGTGGSKNQEAEGL